MFFYKLKGSKKNKVKEIKSNKEKKKENNVTRYGEFITTYFSWLPIEKQKENAKKFEEITKKKK